MNDVDDIKLSDYASAALEEFLKEKAGKDSSMSLSGHSTIEENWELSQFWYDTETADILARTSLEIVGTNGRIACISCPTVMIKLQNIKSLTNECYVFEYDTRFKKLFWDKFVFYDYCHPLNLNQDFKGTFDLVLVDPPYLSRECIEKMSRTAQFLTKDKIILCTGVVMEDAAKEFLGVGRSNFKPCHKNTLGNEFGCFTNFDFDYFVRLIK